MIQNQIEKLNEIFKEFKINAKCIDAKNHRHFSYFDVKLDYGCRINKILKFNREIAIAMKVKTDFAVKVIPEQGIIRLQTSFKSQENLYFNEYFTSTNQPQYFLPLLLGESDEGKPLWLDLHNCPHLLIAGSTGSGKSTLLHTIIENFRRINDVQLFLVDTKKVEFSIYQNNNTFEIPPICAFTYDRTISLLNVLCDNMDKRYDFFSKIGIYNIKEAKHLVKNVLIIDEVSDLMLQQSDKEFELLLIKLAQKARAAGTYIILATQRPSANVITGLIKANFPARLACKVTSKTDSRVILDGHGAEVLSGRGDAIIRSNEHDFVRFQVAYINPYNQN